MADLADSLVSTDDDRLDQAEGLVRDYCGWHIAPSRSTTVTLMGTGGRVLMLPTLYVTEVTTVTCDGVELDPGDYFCTVAGVLTRLHGTWYEQVVVITFVHGYDEAPPAVMKVVQALAQRAVSNPTGATSYTITKGPFTDSASFGGGSSSSSSSSDALFGADLAILDGVYRLHPLK